MILMVILLSIHNQMFDYMQEGRIKSYLDCIEEQQVMMAMMVIITHKELQVINYIN